MDGNKRLSTKDLKILERFCRIGILTYDCIHRLWPDYITDHYHDKLITILEKRTFGGLNE